MGPDIFVPFIFFSFLGAVIIGPILAKERTRRSAHNLVAQAMARGQTLEPSLIVKLTEDMLQEGNRARKSFGSAVVLLALAAGLLGAGYVLSGVDGDAMRVMMVPAVLVGAVGAGFFVLAVFDLLTKKRDA